MKQPDEYYLKIAKEQVSARSKDPSTKIGAIIVDTNGHVLSYGYNGFPRGIEDSAERLNDRSVKYLLTVHAEANAVINAAREGKCTKGSTIYVSGLPPCHECAKIIIQAGISEVIYYDMEIPERWQESITLGSELLYEAGVTVILVKENKC